MKSGIKQIHEALEEQVKNGAIEFQKANPHLFSMSQLVDAAIYCQTLNEVSYPEGWDPYLKDELAEHPETALIRAGVFFARECVRMERPYYLNEVILASEQVAENTDEDVEAFKSYLQSLL